MRKIINTSNYEPGIFNALHTVKTPPEEPYLYPCLPVSKAAVLCFNSAIHALTPTPPPTRIEHPVQTAEEP
jgi:hypothetical protein